jgi:AraC family transcriptional regulator of adaptative response / DNA-3-methyladenine glycosylase II
MFLDADAAYLALKARDARFDGRLFVGVTSTGIYCRPVCRVRTPKRENCRFFATRAQAEAQRFRPCLKCRPEVAPGHALTDSSGHLAHAAARLIEQAVHHGHTAALSQPALAARLGVTDRHLRRIFQATHGVSPRDYMTTQRLLLAKQLLTDTRQPITQVALASGFDSLRRFNATFVERYRLNPTQLRRAALPAAGRTTGASPDDAAITLRLAYRPPYDVAAMLGFFERRQVRGVEAVCGDTWRRTWATEQGGDTLLGWLAMRFVADAHEVHLTVAPSLARVLGALMQRVRQALDLDAQPELIDTALAGLPVPARPGMRLPNGLDGFEVAVRVILGQQVTVKAARTLIQRVVETFGQPIATPFAGLDRLFPTPQALAAAAPSRIGLLGIVRQRVQALQALAQAVADGSLVLDRHAPLDATLDRLRALPGVGEWTAQVIAMRALAWPDAFPATDAGLYNALGSRDPRHLTTLAEAWRPWRAYAVMRLWHHLETTP